MSWFWFHEWTFLGNEQQMLYYVQTASLYAWFVLFVANNEYTFDVKVVLLQNIFSPNK